MVNNPPANEGGIREERSIPGLKRSPGGGHGTHSSAPAWRVPGTEETDGLQSIGLQRVRHDRSNLSLHIFMCVCIYIYTHIYTYACQPYIHMQLIHFTVQ